MSVVYIMMGHECNKKGKVYGKLQRICYKKGLETLVLQGSFSAFITAAPAGE